MRKLQKGKVLAVRAISGLHVVTLAWDLMPGNEGLQNKLLGFAIERAELREGVVSERYYLRGIKRFKSKDEGLPAGTPVPTSEHPCQSFQWGDYTLMPGVTYQYKVIPVYGKPKLLELDLGSSTTIEITTEAVQTPENQKQPIHNVYFNRGAAGSQAYARKFPNTKVDENAPDSEQMKWLSRGLFEALVDFIGIAAGKDAKEYKLRAMLYEFQYLPVGKAFAKAHQAGADVDIRYEAQSYKKHNEEMIAAAEIQNICTPQKSRGGIRHNKFIVLIHKEKPVAVWTGSTNISAGGIFGHSNVGHVIWDEEIARRFLDYWNRLAASDVTRKPLVKENLLVEPTPSDVINIPSERMLTFFSPRDDDDQLETLNWYAKLMDSANKIMCMTFAFNLDPMFSQVLQKPGSVLRYAVFDKPLDPAEELKINQVHNTVIAAGSKLEEGDLKLFLKEKLSGLNKNKYIHNKFMLVDPLGEDPIVVTGTANFSGPSQSENDENMVVIRGNQRVADIYFGEFMRIFDHLYARYIVNLLKNQPNKDPDAGYLKEQAKDWLPQHFWKNSRKDLRRRYFMGE